LLNLRKKKGKRGSPLKNDPTLVNQISKLSAVNDTHSFDTWRKEFLVRLGYFLIDEGIEKAEEAYHVRLRVKVEKLVRIVAKVAHHVNDGSLGETSVTIQAGNALDEGMKSCEDLSTFLKVLSPMNPVEEKIVGFTKYNTASVLVETGFHEYERLNMCRDILQVLREHFVDSVAKPEHVTAFEKFDKEILSFKSIVMDDIGLLPVLKKQRQLKSPEPPKAIIAEIRRGKLRKALMANRIRPEKESTEDANKTIRSRRKGSSKSPTRTTSKSPHGLRNKTPTKSRTSSKSPHSYLRKHTDDAEVRNKSPMKSRTSSKSPHSSLRKRADDAEARNKSPMKRRTTSKSPHGVSKRPVDDSNERKKMRRKKKSKSPKRKSDSSDPKSPSTRRRGLRKSLEEEGNSERQSRTEPKESLNKRSTSSSGATTPSGRSNRTKSTSLREPIREEKTPLYLPLKKETTTPDSPKEDGPIIFSKEMFSSRGSLLSGDDKSVDKSISSIRRKDRSRQKLKNARKGKPSLKNSARERNRIGQKNLQKKELSVAPLSPYNHDLFKLKNDSFAFDRSKEDPAKEGDRSSRDKRSLRRNVRQPKIVEQETTEDDIVVTKPQFDNYVTSHRIDSFELISAIKPTKESTDKQLDTKATRNKKKKTGSKSSKHKRAAMKTGDYKKIIHGKAHPASAKTELPKLNVTGPFPVLFSEVGTSREAFKPAENNPGGKAEESQEQLSDKISTVQLSPLLDISESNSYAEDESSIFQFTSPNRHKYLFHPKNCTTQRNQTLLGLSGSKPGLTLFNQNNAQKKGVNSYIKNYFEKPSFYDNFVKPLTTNESGAAVKREGKFLEDDEKQWGSERSIFEDSVCSSRYISGQSSIDKAIANFKSDQTIIELQKANKTGKKMESEIPKSLLSPISVTRPKNQMQSGKPLSVKSIGRHKVVTRGGEKMKLNEEDNFFDSKEEYTMYDGKQIFTAEEEAARMADEVAKLEIALEDNQHALFCNDLDAEASESSSWRLNEELQLSKNMLNLQYSPGKLLDSNSPGKLLDIKDDENRNDSDNETEKSVEMESKINTRTNNGATDVVQNTVTPQTSKEGESGDEKHEDIDETNEEECENNELDTSHFREVSEALDMVEKMLKLEADRDEVLEEDEYLFSTRLGDSISRFDAGGSFSELNCKIPSKDEEDVRVEPEQDVEVAPESKRSSISDIKSVYSGPSFASKSKKKSEYQPFFSLGSSESLSERQPWKSPRTKEPVSLSSAKQNHKFRATTRENKVTPAARSVRVYDPSARLSRWQTPGVI